MDEGRSGVWRQNFARIRMWSHILAKPVTLQRTRHVDAAQQNQTEDDLANRWLHAAWIQLPEFDLVDDDMIADVHVRQLRESCEDDVVAFREGR